MGLIDGYEVSHMITRAKRALVDGYDLYAIGKHAVAYEKISEAADYAHNARLSLLAEMQLAGRDPEAARMTLSLMRPTK